MIGFAVIGAVIAGAYGILHDQITYTISPEYFTRLKFEQFHYADFGFPRRVFVGEVGFLATWWVGLFAAWFLARLSVPAWPIRKAFQYTLTGFGIIFGSAMAAGVIGGVLGYYRRSNSDFNGWQDYAVMNGVRDLPAFVNIAYIHNAGYLRALAGLIAALGYLKWKKSQTLPCGEQSANNCV
jgi:hypothetical protein